MSNEKNSWKKLIYEYIEKAKTFAIQGKNEGVCFLEKIKKINISKDKTLSDTFSEEAAFWKSSPEDRLKVPFRGRMIMALVSSFLISGSLGFIKYHRRFSTIIFTGILINIYFPEATGWMRGKSV